MNRTAKTLATGLTAAACVGSALVGGPAQAAPAHPDRWLRHEAAQMGCANVHREALPIGPKNVSIRCDAHGQRYSLIYYRQIGEGVAWWRNWTRGGNSWAARDGLVLIVPEGSTEAGADSGLYNIREAGTAARRLNGVVLPL